MQYIGLENVFLLLVLSFLGTSLFLLFTHEHNNVAQVQHLLLWCGKGTILVEDKEILKIIWITCHFDSISENVIYKNKTWSSVSNSSLSKTFALASFESHKYRSSVICFLPTKIVFIEVHFGSQNCRPKIFLGPKNFFFRHKFFFLTQNELQWKRSLERENRASEIEAFKTGKGKGFTLTGVWH